MRAHVGILIIIYTLTIIWKNEIVDVLKGDERHNEQTIVIKYHHSIILLLSYQGILTYNVSNNIITIFHHIKSIRVGLIILLFYYAYI